MNPENMQQLTSQLTTSKCNKKPRVQTNLEGRLQLLVPSSLSFSECTPASDLPVDQLRASERPIKENYFDRQQIY